MARLGSKKSDKKISIMIYPDPEPHARLVALSQATRVPLAVFVREGIDLVLEREELELEKKIET
jgi:predicted DNA-binding protein